MARSLKVASRREDTASTSGWLARLLAKIRRRSARIDHLNGHMLRDIGLGERGSPKLQKSVRGERP
jgi:hypothetical protein